MEPLKSLSELEIHVNEIIYDKSSKMLSVYIVDFTFVGYYKKSTKIKELLDDIYESLEVFHVEREKIYVVNRVDMKHIPESHKLKDLNLRASKEPKIESEEVLKEEKIIEKDIRRKKAKMEDVYEEELMDMEEERAPEAGVSVHELGKVKRKEELPAEFISPPRALAASKAPSQPIDREVLPQSIIYNINMGLQYYPIMMEQRSYLFYVYLSHEELKIIDEEGKTVYKTTFEIVTTKKEPPILELKVEGDGFEAHPLTGQVEVKKDAINPPVMIFSILPTKKSKKERKKLKKKNERRFLNVLINFENKTISHSILSIIVQPKHFHLDIGPIQLHISKKTATLISFLSVLIATVSLIYSAFSIGSSSDAADILSGFAPGLASSIFIVAYIISLVKGFYPLKKKWKDLLNFDKTTPIIK